MYFPFNLILDRGVLIIDFIILKLCFLFTSPSFTAFMKGIIFFQKRFLHIFKKIM